MEPLCTMCGCSVATVVLPDGDGVCRRCLREIAEGERDQDEDCGEPVDWDAFYEATDD